MKFKEMLVFVMLVLGVVGGFGGLAIVSRGESLGWLAVVLAVPMLFVAVRNMRAGRATPES